MGMSECSITRTLTSKGLSQKEAEDPAALLRSHVDSYFGPPEEISRNCFPVWSFERLG